SVTRRSSSASTSRSARRSPSWTAPRRASSSDSRAHGRGLDRGRGDAPLCSRRGRSTASATVSAFHAILIVGAGVGAGIANAIVGSGTLITFPTLLAFGYAPVTANVSNTLGLVPGNITSMIGYRPEMAGQRDRGIRLGLASMLGAAAGAILLLVLPASAFRAVVPAFIGLGVFAILVGPYVSKW